MSLAVCFFPVILHARTQPAPPERPRVLIDTRLAVTPVIGQTIVVSAGGELQAALDRAAPGDEIVLEAGATFTGNFVLPARPADGRWTTIRSSRMDDLPADGHRVGPEHAAAMPRIVDPSGNGAFRTVAGTCYWRIMGLEITVAPDVENAWALVHFGSGGQGDADWAAIGFVDFDGGDYRLSPASPYRGRATDGSDLGADPDLALAISAASNGSPSARP